MKRWMLLLSMLLTPLFCLGMAGCCLSPSLPWPTYDYSNKTDAELVELVSEPWIQARYLYFRSSSSYAAQREIVRRGKRMVPLLIEGETRPNQHGIRETLEEMGAIAFPDIVECIRRHPDADHTRWAELNLSDPKYSRDLRPLLPALLSDPDSRIRDLALVHTLWTAEESTIPSLFGDVSTDPKRKHRFAQLLGAVIACRFPGSRGLVDFYLGLAENDNDLSWMSTITFQPNIQGREAWKTWWAKHRDESPGEWWKQSLDDDSWKYLGRAARNQPAHQIILKLYEFHPDRRWGLIEPMGRIGHLSFVPVLIQALDERDSRNFYILQALGLIGRRHGWDEIVDWKRWWAEHKDDPQFVQAGSAP